jgi:hypothetical protein
MTYKYPHIVKSRPMDRELRIIDLLSVRNKYPPKSFQQLFFGLCIVGLPSICKRLNVSHRRKHLSVRNSAPLSLN